MIYITRGLSDEEMKTALESEEFKKYVKKALDNPDPEPFCPFIFGGYCNDAYTEICYSCEEAIKYYLKIDCFKVYEIR